MQETWVGPLGGEDPLEKGMAPHSGILAWRIPWTEEPDGLEFMGSQRLRMFQGGKNYKTCTKLVIRDTAQCTGKHIEKQFILSEARQSYASGEECRRSE